MSILASTLGSLGTAFGHLLRHKEPKPLQISREEIVTLMAGGFQMSENKAFRAAAYDMVVHGELSVGKGLLEEIPHFREHAPVAAAVDSKDTLPYKIAMINKLREIKPGQRTAVLISIYNDLTLTSKRPATDKIGRYIDPETHQWIDKHPFKDLDLYSDTPKGTDGIEGM